MKSHSWTFYIQLSSQHCQSVLHLHWEIILKSANFFFKKKKNEAISVVFKIMHSYVIFSLEHVRTCTYIIHISLEPYVTLFSQHAMLCLSVVIVWLFYLLIWQIWSVQRIKSVWATCRWPHFHLPHSFPVVLQTTYVISLSSMIHSKGFIGPS